MTAADSPTHLRPVIFLLPANHHLPTGGNLYNRRIMTQLEQAGVPVHIAEEHADNLDPSRHVVVDSLLLDRARKRPGAAGRTLALLHYLPSLIPNSGARVDREIDHLRELDMVVVTSNLLRDHLRENGLDIPISVIPPALHVSPDDEAPREIPGDELRVFMCANLLPAKGVLDFLEALCSRMDERHRLHLRIAGRKDADPRYTLACEKIIQAGFPEAYRPRLLGSLDAADLAREYASHHIFVSASLMETYGMALAEARAFGLYILARDCGYAGSHVAHERVGLLFQDIPSMAMKLLEFAQNPADFGRLRRDALASREEINYDWSDAADLFLQALQAAEAAR